MWWAFKLTYATSSGTSRPERSRMLSLYVSSTMAQPIVLLLLFFLLSFSSYFLRPPPQEVKYQWPVVGHRGV